MKKVLIVDNYDSFTYNIVQLVREHGQFNHRVISNDRIDLNDLSEYDKIIISPGPGVPSETPATIEIISNFGNNKSILGICLGHQAIAEAYGGKIYNLGRPCHGIKQKVQIKDYNDYIFSNIPPLIDAGLYHSWAVAEESLPGDLKITAKSTEGIIMAISHSRVDVKGIQFHPESVMTRHGTEIINNWLNH